MSKKNRSPKKTAVPVNLIQNPAADRFLAWVFLAALVVVPLVMRFAIISHVAPVIANDLLNTGLKTDLCGYYRHVFLLIFALLAVAALFYKMFSGHYSLDRSRLNLPLLLFALLVILSALTAEYKWIAVHGMYGRFEGAITWMCYLVLALAAANTVFKPPFARRLTVALSVVVIVNSITSLSAFLQFNLLELPAIRSLVVSAELSRYLQGVFVTTLGNPNYLSGFAAAGFAFFLVASMAERSRKWAAVDGVMAVCSLVCVLCSLSSSGFAALIAVTPFLLWFAVKRGRGAGKRLGTVLAACVLVFVALNGVNSTVWDETFGIARGLKAVPAVTAPGSGAGLGTEAELEVPARAVSAGSGRLYIWEKTWELVKERPWFGHGPDTLAYCFPDNAADKISGLGSYDVSVDKAHSFYLTLAFNAGLPALLIFLFMCGLHFFQTARTLKKEDENYGLRAALFAFWLAFLIQWLVNDSVIGTAPVFWILFGIAVSLNNRWEESAKQA